MGKYFKMSSAEIFVQHMLSVTSPCNEHPLIPIIVKNWVCENQKIIFLYCELFQITHGVGGQIAKINSKPE